MTHQRPATLSVCFLNLWGSRQDHKLAQFLEQTAGTIDVYCFTEVTDHFGSAAADRCYTSRTNPHEPPMRLDGLWYANAYLHASHRHFYVTPHRDTWRCTRTNREYQNVGFGSALFVRHATDTWLMEQYGDRRLCATQPGVRPRMLQWAIVAHGGVRTLIAHLHGIWVPDNTKGDDPRRHVQSAEIIATLQGLATTYEVDQVIFGGDLNLDLHTEALLHLERTSINTPVGYLRNLVREYNVPPHPGTRTPLYRRFDDPEHTNYADYVFVSEDVRVAQFAVLNGALVSDHAPLVVTVS